MHVSKLQYTVALIYYHHQFDSHADDHFQRGSPLDGKHPRAILAEENFNTCIEPLPYILEHKDGGMVLKCGDKEAPLGPYVYAGPAQDTPDAPQYIVNVQNGMRLECQRLVPPQFRNYAQEVRCSSFP